MITLSENLFLAAMAAVMVLPYVFIFSRRRIRATAARKATGEWPSVPGRIITSQLQRHGMSTGSLTTSSYRATVWYEYIVDGQRYSNDVVDPGDALLREKVPNLTFLTKVHPDEAVRRYPEGADVSVYYDPSDPKRSCLER